MTTVHLAWFLCCFALFLITYRVTTFVLELTVYFESDIFASIQQNLLVDLCTLYTNYCCDVNGRWTGMMNVYENLSLFCVVC